MSNPLNTAEYHSYIQKRDHSATFNDSPHTIYPFSSITQTTQKETSAHEKIETFSVLENDKHGQNFLRVTNVNGLFPLTDAVLVMTPENYTKLQQLGITQHNDQAFTAKVLGAIGEPRFRVLKDQEQYDLRTTLFAEEEKICQHAFSRFYALQIIERAFGKDWDEVISAIENYIVEIAKKLDPLDRQTLQDNSIESRYYLELKQDQEKANNLLRHFKDLKAETPSTTSQSAYGFDPSKFPIEKFVRSVANKIVDDTKFENELLTIANGNNLFRGTLEVGLGKAEKICTNYHFNQNQLITPEHQGDYSALSYVSVSSLKTVGDSREGLRKFLLASSYILSNQDVFNEPNEHFGTPTQTRGWTRLFRKERANRDIIKGYYHLRKLAAKANLSRLKSIADDIWDLSHLIGHALVKAAGGILSTFGHEFYKIYTDLTLQKPIQQPVKKITDAEFKIIIDENWERWSIKEKINYTINTFVKALDKKNITLTEEQKQFLEQLRNPNANVAPLAIPPSLLTDTDPDDFLSSGIGGLEAFFNVFDELHEINPCIAVYCLTLYALAGIAVTSPAVAMTIFEKLRLSALSNGFITWHTATAQAMTNGMASNVVSAGFTAWQELFVALNGLSAAGDSIAGDIAKFINHHLPKALAAIAVGYGIGHLITDVVKIPGLSQTLKEDEGKIPFFEKFFAGLKLGTIGYEGFQSRPETQSAFANLVSFILKCVIYPIRLLVISPINFILSIFNPKRLENAIKPWIEFGYSVKSAGLRGTDAFLRLLNLTGRFIKLMVKTAVEWFANTLAILTKLAGILVFIPAKENKISKGIIEFKTRLFEGAGSAARKIKDAYRFCRNELAKEIGREEDYVVETTASLFKRLNISGDAALPAKSIKLTQVAPETMTRSISQGSQIEITYNQQPTPGHGMYSI